MPFANLAKYAKEVENMAPELAYKFVNEKMTDEAWRAIDMCLLMEGATPEWLANIIGTQMNHGKEIPATIRKFFSKALEHRKWLLDTVGNDL